MNSARSGNSATLPAVNANLVFTPLRPPRAALRMTRTVTLGAFLARIPLSLCDISVVVVVVGNLAVYISSPLELWRQAGRLHRHCPIFTAAVWLASPTDSCLCEAVCTPQTQQDGAEGPQDGQARPKARRAPSLPPCRAARLASIERAPPPRAVDQSGPCPRPLTFQRVSWAALHASDLARRRRGPRDGPTGSTATRCAVGRSAWGRARDGGGGEGNSRPRSPQQFSAVPGRGTKQRGRRTARGARPPLRKDSRPACSRSELFRGSKLQ